MRKKITEAHPAVESLKHEQPKSVVVPDHRSYIQEWPLF